MSACPLTCPRCRITTNDPAQLPGEPCPACGGPLLAASDSPLNPLPLGKPFGGAEWMRPASIIAIITAIAGFVAGFNFGGGLIAGLLNPLFFVGMSLGIYWWRWSQSGFQCPHCEHRNPWSTINPRRFPSGKSVKCLTCRRSFLVPARV